MAITSSRKVVVSFAGDIIATYPAFADDNAAANGAISNLDLISGANTITLPAGTVRGATIVPPSGNTEVITLKGVTGDTGIPLHVTDPTSISFDASTPPVSFVLTVGGNITGLKIFWS